MSPGQAKIRCFLLAGGLFWTLFWTWPLACPAATAFQPDRDGFAFANETVFQHPNQPGASQETTLDTPDMPYSRRCFVMTRALLQFWRQSLFEPDAPVLEPEVYRERVRAIVRRPAWLPSCDEKDRIRLPGYRDLREFSAAHPRLLQEELGGGLATYFRLANWRLVMPFPDASQQRTAARLKTGLAEAGPQAVFLTRGTAMNHAVVVYALEDLPGGGLTFHAVDPNLPDTTMALRFDGRRFSWPATFYFGGGPINVYLIYTHPLD